ncbi:hypothetical protein F5972_01280 [Microbispora cellulosiformans]|uniref:Uncharacterized protein n=1 Tax=Microbispora cellulosiformans TaxID=2614688 RepID=A0A5J5KCE3_9ACTN|nr:hypothetical protein [Microbispora cellulosiformans]KAA9381498.1 hypothetical protein F5972_01280 [Microbispora cellulosiformans]
MGRRKYRDERRHYTYIEAVVLDRVLDENTQAALRMLPGQPMVTPASFSASVDWDDYTREMERFVERTFDAWLFFDNTGPRTVAFRIPGTALSAQAVAPYAHGDVLEGLNVETSGDDLLLRLRMYAEDSELFNLHETGAGWLQDILPVRAELMSGTLDALELAPVVGTHWDEIERDVSAEYGLSQASRVLAAYLQVAPEELKRLAARRTQARQTELPPGWLSGCSDREPVARWEFAAADPRKSFEITLGRLPGGCEYGDWYVTATEPRGRDVAFRAEDDARKGYHDEALRLQRLNDPGRWRRLDQTG